MSWTHKSQPSKGDRYGDKQHFRHWYRDNQVYFISVSCSDRYPALRSEDAKAIFWDRFEHYTSQHRFAPWITSVMDNHYHTLGYCEIGRELGEMMRKIHGSVAKLVNDLLPKRRVPFWGDPGHQDYFEGCIRDEGQCRRAYRYVLTQSVRHGVCEDWREYPHTRVRIELERGLKRVLELNAFLRGVRYKRYEKGGGKAHKPGSELPSP